MQTHMMAEVIGVAEEIKGLTCKASYLKTKTKLELRFTKDDRAKLDVYGGINGDIKALKLEGSPSSLVVTVEGAQAIGRLVNRSVTAFGKIGIGINKMDWEAESGVINLEESTLPLNGSDLPMLMEVMTRLVMRSVAPISHTHHLLTLFDLKQAVGVVYDAKQGDKSAEAILDWFNIRELILLEEAKEAKAEAKAKEKKEKAKEIAEKKKAKADERKEAREKAKAEAKAKEKNSGKGKAKAKAKPKTADLSKVD